MVVGGGSVAFRKAASLSACGADVLVVSPRLNKGFKALIRRGALRHAGNNYAAKFLKGAFLAVAATDDAVVNSRVASDAAKAGLLVNVVDCPSLSNFWVPAVLRRGPLVIGISTSGMSPFFAARLKQSLSAYVGREHAQLVSLMAVARKKIRAAHKSPSKRNLMYSRIIGSSIPALLKAGKTQQARKVLSDILKQGEASAL